MIHFNNDYNHGAHQSILDALQKTNSTSYSGYGLDVVCDEARAIIRKLAGNEDAEVHFLEGGTQANATVITAALRPYQSAVCADSGHIFSHETGAIEHNGHKVETLPGVDGKISASQIEEKAYSFSVSTVPEHIPQPKLVYISQPTEFGTLYTLSELQDIRKVCDKYGLYLYVDGARLSYALSAPSNDVSLKDLGRLTDVFYIGGTKCGALFGEAVVINNKSLQTDFRSYIKMCGGMLAKGWLLGLQFKTLLEDGLYTSIAGKSIEQAFRIKDALEKKNIRTELSSPTNQQFYRMPNDVYEKLSEDFVLEYEGYIDEKHSLIRICTAWSSTEEEVSALIKAIESL